MDQDRILTYSSDELHFEPTFSLLLLRNVTTKNIINTRKLNFAKTTSCMPCSVKRIPYIDNYSSIFRVTPELVSATEIISTSFFERLAVEQGKFLKKSNALRVASSDETPICKVLY